ncbi:MAG: FecR domain-containing protein [Flavobacterium sp.]
MKKNNILLKKITSDFNDDEEILFQEWLQKSDKNKLLYEKLLLLKQEKNLFKLVSELDTNAAWKLVQEKSKQNSTPKFVFRKRIVKYAVGTTVALLISLSLIYIRTDFFSSPTETSSIIVNNNIKAGTDKAILTLEDGSEVALQKGSTYQTAKAESNGEEIIYKASKTQNPTTSIAYNTLTIPRGGQFTIKLEDGTQVWLNSESQIRYPVVFPKNKTRQVELVYGEAYFDVSSSTNHNGAAFKVFNKVQEVVVLGTEFNIKAYKDETKVYTTLIEGKVSVTVVGPTTSNQQPTKILVPNQQLTLDTQTQKVKVQTVEVANVIAWKKGDFSFERKSLKEIAKVLSRWYDMNLVFENKALEKIEFTGVLGKEQKIEEILATIQELKFIKSYEIRNKEITIK